MITILNLKKNYINSNKSLRHNSIKDNKNFKKKNLLESKNLKNIKQKENLFLNHFKKKIKNKFLKNFVRSDYLKTITGKSIYFKNNKLQEFNKKLNISFLNNSFINSNVQSDNNDNLNNFNISNSDIDEDNNSNEYYLDKIKNSLSEMSKISKKDLEIKKLRSDPKHITWKVLTRVVHSQENIDLLTSFQNDFNELRKTSNLSSDFDIEDPTTTFQFNSSPIYKNSKEEILKSLKKFFPNLKDRQLISNYSNSDILLEARRAFLRRTPNIMNFSPIHSHINYLIDKLPDGNIQLVVVYLSDLAQIKYDSSEFYNTFGLRAKCILYKNKIPDIKYSYFVK
ncbi:MAG: hypothetical protein G8D26_01995 [Buchnera aphidicola (Periphyllus acericola)]|uniref:hypothetical protein n=1 Tax=Buchnera aphidicola TaxID=9 RepID=UPI0030D30C72|nr:hypothetical protein [Buchnera aphidicola (Periphyllus acericola)]